MSLNSRDLSESNYKLILINEDPIFFHFGVVPDDHDRMKTRGNLFSGTKKHINTLVFLS